MATRNYAKESQVKYEILLYNAHRNEDKEKFDFIMNMIDESEEPDLEELKERIKTLSIENYRKTHFGEIIMLIINNLLTKPCFSGYTDNWKTDFRSNAVEHILKYSHNFDYNKTSKRTGKPVKAFAYLTQITYMAIIAVINVRKKEQDFMKNALPYETSSFVNNFSFQHNESDYFYDAQPEVHSVHVENKDFVLDKIAELTKTYTDIEIIYGDKTDLAEGERDSLPIDVYEKINTYGKDFHITVRKDFVPVVECELPEIELDIPIEELELDEYPVDQNEW